MRQFYKKVMVTLLAVMLMVMAVPPGAVVGNGIAVNSSVGEDNLLQFTSAGHVLGFSKDSVVIASASHMLKTEFIGANAVSPETEQNTSDETTDDTTPLFNRVTYPNLWDDVTVVYEAREGAIVKSTYYVDTTEEGTAVDNIRLGYNRPVSVDENGNLIIAYETGTLMETAPIAWQEIGDRRDAVEVSYVPLGDREIGFSLGDHVSGIPVIIDPELNWNTFLGGTALDEPTDIAVDSSGNIYISGFSHATWDSPLRAYTSDEDGFVAKLDSSGGIIWLTFLGASGNDRAYGIAVDSSGDIFVGGYSSATWGTPVRSYTSDIDGFAVKLDSSGSITWSTFLGGSGNDYLLDLEMDNDGNVYIGGWSTATWGSPVQTIGGTDGFAAKLDGSGNLTWNTFVGGTSGDYSYRIAVDGSENVYLTGYSTATWGSPVRAFSPSFDVFAVKLDSSGGYVWNTFLGSAETDIGNGIAVDSSGNVYVGGYSSSTWGSPVRAYSGDKDGFAAKLDSSGNITWNTFFGSSALDIGEELTLDSNGNLYMIGQSTSTWGSPERAHSGFRDAVVVKYDSDGNLTWHTFLGSSALDLGYGIAVDSSGNIYAGGRNFATWGSPVRAFTADYDASITKLIAPEMSVEGNSVEIADGDSSPSTADHTDFGSADIASDTVVRTFTINNTGSANLTLSDTPIIAVGGTNAADFTVTADATTPVAASGNTTFQVTFNPSATGVRSATLSIANDDSDENPYNFSIQGTGTSANSFNAGPVSTPSGGNGAPVTAGDDIAPYVSRDGMVTKTRTIGSFDDSYQLTLEKGITVKTKIGTPLYYIHISAMRDSPLPPEDAGVIGSVYKFYPAGATFDPPATLSTIYDPSDLPEGISEGNLVIAYYDAESGEWIKLDSTVDRETNTITAKVSHFTAFTILAYTRPAAFAVSDLTVSPTEVDIGESVIISVILTNTGDLTGDYQVTLKIDNVETATEEVTLAGGASQTVTFTTAKDVSGTYSVTVDSLSGTFMVKPLPVPALVPPPKPASPVPSPTPPPTPPTAVNQWLIGGIIAGCVVAGLLVYFFVWRKRVAL